MRFALIAMLALAASVSAHNGKDGKKNDGNGKKNVGKGKGKTSSNKSHNGGGGGESLCLDKKLVQSASFSNGHNASNPQQADSLTDKSNFINFCKGKTITNGLQVLDGSCNGIVMGDIPDIKNMVSAKFQFPRNFDTVPPFQDFTVKVKINGLKTGNFVDAKGHYYAAPQQVGKDKRIIGHTHIVIDKVNGFQDTNVGAAQTFAFFKGIDTGVDGQGLNSVVVSKGLPEGTYRLATINTAANHQPVLMPVAQHISVDDMVYFTVSKKGKNGRRHHPAGAHEHDQ